MWVNEYLLELHGEARGLEIIADIDHRYGSQSIGPFLSSIYFLLHSISAVPPYPGLRRFPDGRDFLQWTGDDSKALMKVSFTWCGMLFILMTSLDSTGLPWCYCGTRPCCGCQMPVGIS